MSWESYWLNYKQQKMDNNMKQSTKALNSMGFPKDPKDTRVLVAMSGRGW